MDPASQKYLYTPQQVLEKTVAYLEAQIRELEREEVLIRGKIEAYRAQLSAINHLSKAEAR